MAEQTSKGRRNTIIGIIAAVVIVIAIAGGLFVADFLADPDDTPPVAPTLEAGENQVVYRIDPEQSEVRYSIDEVFLEDNRTGTAIGVTQGIAGDVLIDFNNPDASQLGTFVINIEQFESDSQIRDAQIRREYLESSTYPLATFEATEYLRFPEDPVIGEVYEFQITGDLTVREITAPAEWDISVMVEEEMVTGTANTTVLLSTYLGSPISIAGVLNTEDELRLTFEFTALPVEEAFDSAAEATLEGGEIESTTNEDNAN